MKSFLIGALLAFALVHPAAAREGQKIAVALAVDSGAVMQIGDDGTGVAALEGKKLDEPTPWVRSVALHFTNGKYDWAKGEKSISLRGDATLEEPDPVVPGQIGFAFRKIGDSDHRLLVIANGYDRALVYRAQIRVKGEDRYTDVCMVPPGTHAFEHWPYASERILMADFHLEAWTKGQAPRCE